MSTDSLATLITEYTDEPMWSAVVIAKRILTSHWLAAHDAQVRADERQKIAALLADEHTVETVAEALSEHDDQGFPLAPSAAGANLPEPPGWTCDDDDRLVYECLCGDRSPALDQDYIGPDDAETAGAWHRAHVAHAALDVLAGLIGGEQ